MGKQYPDLVSNPQKILLCVSLFGITIITLILAIFEFKWSSRLDFCDDLLIGKAAAVTKITIGGGSVACITILIALLILIFLLIIPLLKNCNIYLKIELLKYGIIITGIFAFITAILGIVVSIFGLNHKENGLCLQYIYQGLEANELCTFGSSYNQYPDYSKQTAKIMAKLAEDPGYYCEKVGRPVLIVSIIDIVVIIISIVGYCMGKAHPIEESSVAEGEVDEGNIEEKTNNPQEEA